MFRLNVAEKNFHRTLSELSMFQDITLSLDGAIGKKVLSLGNFKFLNLC